MIFLTYKDLHTVPDKFLHVSASDINPATGKAYAINPSTGNWDDNYFANNFGGGSSGGLDATGQYIQNQVQQLDQTYFNKLKDFDTNNPFVYDDVLAQETTKAASRLDPYYMQQLNDYMKGVTLQSQRSLEDKNTTLSNLNASLDSYTQGNQESLQAALDKSRSGYADVGMYNSGAQQKNTATAGLDSNEALKNFQTTNQQGVDQANTTNIRNQQDLNQQTAIENREVGSYDPTKITATNPTGFQEGATSAATTRSQAINQIPVDQAQRQFALNQYAGPPPGADPNQFYLQQYSGLQG